MQFIKRLSAPSQDDLHWIKRSSRYNGYNRCIVIDQNTGSVLPNCTGYAWGRFLEEQNITDCRLSRANAENWYTNIGDGYQRGGTPKLGAVICWEGEGSKAGHVAIVEEIYEDGSITTSNSAYSGSRFYTKKLSPPYFMGRGYTFQGFIYPEESFTPVPPQPIVLKKTNFKWVLYSRKLRQKRMFAKK